MTRKKVKLAWISNDSSRRASLKKRRMGLLKKLSELTTLCGVNACTIIYSPDETEPMVWPSHTMVQQQIARFKSMPELDQIKKMMNQETYLKERVTKVQDQVLKCQRKNKEAEMGHLMRQIHQGKRLNEFHINELQGLAWLVEEKMKEIRRRINYYEQLPLPLNLPPPQGLIANDQTTSLGSLTAASFAGDHNPIDYQPVSWEHWFINTVNNTEPKPATTTTIIRTDNNMGLPPFHLYDEQFQPTLPINNYNSFYGSDNFGNDQVGNGIHPYGGNMGANSSIAPSMGFSTFDGKTNLPTNFSP